MSDLISRQAAIDALKKKMDKSAKGEIGSFFNTIVLSNVETLILLPSAQPYTCEYWDDESNYCALYRPSAQPGLDEWCHDCAEYDQERHCCPRFNRVIRETLEEIQPMRKKGKWIRITQGATPEQYMCPFCHRTVETNGVEELLSIRYPYCHCGADMRGDTD